MASILVVDDSSFSRKAIIKILESGGHEGTGVAGYERCLEILGKSLPDLVICDLLMPGKSGYDLLEHLREMHPGIPAIVITADIQDSAGNRCLELGAKKVLNKPLERAELLKAVSEAIPSVMAAK